MSGSSGTDGTSEISGSSGTDGTSEMSGSSGTDGTSEMSGSSDTTVLISVRDAGKLWLSREGDTSEGDDSCSVNSGDGGCIERL